MKTFFNAFSEDSLQKRLLWLNTSNKSDTKTLSEEVGLEAPEKLHEDDSMEDIQQKISQVYTIGDAEKFTEVFGDFILEHGLVTGELPGALENADGEFQKHHRDAVLRKLIEQFTVKVSEKGQRAIDKLPLSTDTDDVTEVARANILRLQESADPRVERGMFQTLADTVGSLGVQKTELERTNELNEQKQMLEQRVKSVKAQLDNVNKLHGYVDNMEKKALEKAGWWDKAYRVAFSLPVGALHLTARAGLGIVTSPLQVPRLLGSIVSRKYREDLSKDWNNYWGDFKTYYRNQALSWEEKDSIELQRDLLRNGKIDMKTGDTLYKFKIPPSPILPQENGPDKIHSNRILVRNGFINGRKIGGTAEEAHPGDVVTGEVVLNGLADAPNGKKEIILYKNQEELQIDLGKEQEALDIASSEYQAHKGRLDNKKRGFMEQYKFLEKKVKEQEAAMRKATLHVAALQSRTASGGRATAGELTPEQENFAKAEKSLKKATEALDRSRKALKEMDRVKRIFDLNDEFNKSPVPQGMIDSLYGESLNPELSELIKKLSKEQDERTTDAQKKLGAVSAQSLASHMESMSADDREEFLKSAKEYLRDISRKGTGANSLWGSKSETELLRLPKAEFLKKLKKGNKALYEVLISVPSLTKETRYPGGSRSQDLIQLLIEKFDRAGDIVQGQEDEAAAAEEGNRTLPEAPEIADAADIIAHRVKLKMLKSTPPNHLEGVYEILENNGRAVRELIQEALDHDGKVLKMPSILGSSGSLMAKITTMSQKDSDELNSLIEYIEEKGVVTRLNSRGEVLAKKERKIKINEKMADQINDATIDLLGRCKEQYEKLPRKVASVTAIKFSEIKSIALSDTSFIKGGPGSADMKVMETFEADSIPHKLRTKKLTESDNKQHLELVLFTLEKMFRLMEGDKPVLELSEPKTGEYSIVHQGDSEEFFYDAEYGKITSNKAVARKKPKTT